MGNCSRCVYGYGYGFTPLVQYILVLKSLVLCISASVLRACCCADLFCGVAGALADNSVYPNLVLASVCSLMCVYKHAVTAQRSVTSNCRSSPVITASNKHTALKDCKHVCKVCQVTTSNVPWYGVNQRWSVAAIIECFLVM